MVSNRRKKSRGFTLLELLIAMGILSVLTLGVVQSLRRAMANKKRITTLNNHQATLRDAMDVIARDIKMAYHYRDYHYEIDKKVQKEIEKLKKKKQQENKNKNQTSGATSSSTPEPATITGNEEEERDNSTHFYGTDDEMHFISLNLPRIRVDQATADFAEIGYRLGSCKSRTDLKQDTKCIIRRVSPVVDNNIEKGGREIALLENVTKLSFRYNGLGKFDYVREWKTFNTSDTVTKDRFPEFVKVEFEVSLPVPGKDKPRTYKRSRTIPILFPNNPTDDEYEDEEDEDDLYEADDGFDNDLSPEFDGDE